MVSAAPDRTDRVDNSTYTQGREFARACGHSLPGRQPLRERGRTQALAFSEQIRTGSLVNGAIHAPASQQGGIGGIDDRVAGVSGDVPKGNEKTTVTQGFQDFHGSFSYCIEDC